MKKIIVTIQLWLVFSAIHVTASTISVNERTRPSFDSIQTIFQKIQHYDRLEITFNFDSILLNRRSDLEQSADLVWKGDRTTDFVITSKIRPRGRFRRMKCEIPPIRLNFNKEDLAHQQLYAQYDKLKLVTHCVSSKADVQFLLKEYWTYKMYNELSDSSFRVHLVEITYIDKVDPSRKMESYAILLENSDEMAHRLNGELISGIGIPVSQLSPSTYQNVMMFNYMIGNTDWLLKTQKNLKVVKHLNSNLYTVVPYDFDFSALVDAPYRRVNKSIPNLDEYNRAAGGKFLNKESLELKVKQFQSLQKTGFLNFKECTVLRPKGKVAMQSYLKTFFKEIKNKKKVFAAFL